ncbi:MAG: TetR/AcrR family transcriptional regulator [Chitinophagales bacterium]|nr:TetR/AcrR family transcriptional regulator [Chitinophagales bacterium]
MDLLKTDKQAQILLAAEKLFAEHGFDATSTRALAAEAGVNIAMIAYYYGSKEQLFRALLEKRASEFREKLNQLKYEKKSYFEQLSAYATIYVDRIFEKHQFHKIIQRELGLMQRSDSNDAIADILLTNAGFFKEAIQNGINEGEFRPDVDIELTIMSIIGTISQITTMPYLSLRMLHGNPDNENIYGEKYKNRLKKHLVSVLASHLKN